MFALLTRFAPEVKRVIKPKSPPETSITFRDEGLGGYVDGGVWGEEELWWWWWVIRGIEKPDFSS